MPENQTVPINVGLQLRLIVGGQIVPITINNINAVREGKEPIILQNPEGVTLRLEDFKTFLKNRFNVDEAAIPGPVNRLLGNTSITLNEFYLLLPPVDDQGKPIAGKEGDFKFSITVAFDKAGKGGILTDLLGVDMSDLLDIQEVTIGIWKGNIPLEYKGIGLKPARLPAPPQQLMEKPAEKSETEG
jgi:hypothetical protein